MRPISSGSASSCIYGVIDDDAVDLIGDILKRIRHPLEILEDLASDGEFQRALLGALERAS